MSGHLPPKLSPSIYTVSAFTSTQAPNRSTFFQIQDAVASSPSVSHPSRTTHNPTINPSTATGPCAQKVPRQPIRSAIVPPKQLPRVDSIS